jgi:hypothetical protein
MQKYYNKWIAETIKELIPTGKFRRPSYKTVAHWVKDLWDAVDVNLIWRSFKYCGISNKRDGTEDDWIFNYNCLKQKNQLNDKVEVLSDKEDESDGEYENKEDKEYNDKEKEDKEYDDEEEEDDECDEEEEECKYREEASGNFLRYRIAEICKISRSQLFFVLFLCNSVKFFNFADC